MILYNIPDIVATEEYQNDYVVVQQVVRGAIANSDLVADDSVWIYIVTSLLTISRYYTRHIPDNSDIDETNYINLLQQMTAADLPDINPNTLPLVEFLRNSKSWYGHKSVETLFEFMGAMVGTRIEVDYPANLIARWDMANSLFDGAASAGGAPLPFNESKLAIYEDGYYYTQFTYLLNVLDAQSVQDFSDLLNLFASINPAGMQAFTNFIFTWFTRTTSKPVSQAFFGEVNYFWYTSRNIYYPGFDNGLCFDTIGSYFDGGLGWQLDVEEIPRLDLHYAYDRLSTSTLFNKNMPDPSRPWICFSRYIANPNGTVTEVFADNDLRVNVNTTTNMGLASYNWGILKNLSWREWKNTAWNLDKKNMTGQAYYNESPALSVHLS